MRQAIRIGSSKFVHLAFAVVIGMVGACGSSSEIDGKAITGATSASYTIAGAPLTTFNLTGFGAATTGGGVIAETDAAYRKCSTPIEFATAIRDSNKTQGAVRVIEIMNDLDLGWNEVDSTVKTLPSTPFRSHAAPKLHPRLLTTGVSVSVIDIKTKGGGLTIFSANGATVRHASLYIKGTTCAGTARTRATRSDRCRRR